MRKTVVLLYYRVGNRQCKRSKGFINPFLATCVHHLEKRRRPDCVEQSLRFLRLRHYETSICTMHPAKHHESLWRNFFSHEYPFPRGQLLLIRVGNFSQTVSCFTAHPWLLLLADSRYNISQELDPRFRSQYVLACLVPIVSVFVRLTKDKTPRLGKQSFPVTAAVSRTGL